MSVDSEKGEKSTDEREMEMEFSRGGPPPKKMIRIFFPFFFLFHISM